MLFTAAGVMLLSITLATAAARGRGVPRLAPLSRLARTVVIEVPQGKETFTAAGLLSPQAIVKTLLLDAGVVCSRVVCESQLIFKALEK
jgi:hypothetical protein